MELDKYCVLNNIDDFILNLCYLLLTKDFTELRQILKVYASDISFPLVRIQEGKLSFIEACDNLDVPEYRHWAYIISVYYSLVLYNDHEHNSASCMVAALWRTPLEYVCQLKIIEASQTSFGRRKVIFPDSNHENDIDKDQIKFSKNKTEHPATAASVLRVLGACSVLLNTLASYSRYEEFDIFLEYLTSSRILIESAHYYPRYSQSAHRRSRQENSKDDEDVSNECDIKNDKTQIVSRLCELMFFAYFLHHHHSNKKTTGYEFNNNNNNNNNENQQSQQSREDENEGDDDSDSEYDYDDNYGDDLFNSDSTIDNDNVESVFRCLQQKASFNFSFRTGVHTAAAIARLSDRSITRAGLTLHRVRGFMYFFRARLFDNQHLFGEAEQDYSKAINLIPEAVVIYNNRGITKKRQSDLHGAINDFDQALELKSNYAKAYFNCANCYRNLGDNYEAERYYIKATDADPLFETGIFARANNLFEMQQWTSARNMYHRVIELSGNPAALFNLVLVHIRLGYEDLESNWIDHVAENGIELFRRESLFHQTTCSGRLLRLFKTRAWRFQLNQKHPFEQAVLDIMAKFPHDKIFYSLASEYLESIHGPKDFLVMMQTNNYRSFRSGLIDMYSQPLIS